MIVKNYLIGLILILLPAAIFVGGMFLSNVFFDRTPFWWFLMIALLSIGSFFGEYFLMKKIVNKK